MWGPRAVTEEPWALSREPQQKGKVRPAKAGTEGGVKSGGTLRALRKEGAPRVCAGSTGSQRRRIYGARSPESVLVTIAGNPPVGDCCPPRARKAGGVTTTQQSLSKPGTSDPAPHFLCQAALGLMGTGWLLCLQASQSHFQGKGKQEGAVSYQESPDFASSHLIGLNSVTWPRSRAQARAGPFQVLASGGRELPSCLPSSPTRGRAGLAVWAFRWV